MRQILLIIFCVAFSIAAYTQTAQDYYIKASALHGKRENKTALDQINKAIALDSLKIIYLTEKADILKDLKMYQESYNFYSQAISLLPVNYNLYNNRGILLYSIQEFDGAILDFSKGLEFAVSDSDRNMLLVNRAAAKIYKRDFDEAYKDLITVYKNDSSDIGMLTNLASICDEIGKGDETLKYLKRVIKLDPDNIPAYGNIGFKYQDMGDHKTAIEYYDKVIKLKPDDPLGYSNRSFNKLKLGDIKGAYSDIEKSLQFYPENSYAYRIRALIYIQDKKIELACKDLNKAVDLGFTNMYGDEVEKLKLKYCSK